MADTIKQIKEFTKLTDFGDNDLLLCQSDNTTYSIPGTAVKQYAVESAAAQTELAQAAASDATTASGAAESAKAAAETANSNAQSASISANSAMTAAQSAQSAAETAKSGAASSAAAAAQSAQEAKDVVLGNIPDGTLTETKLTTAAQAKLNGGHNHTKSQITDFSHTHEQSDITGLSTSLAANAADHPHRNLLDNWDFRNPVNQRGLSEYATDGAYAMDRWFISGTETNVSISGSVVTLTRSANQTNFGWLLTHKIENYKGLAGKQVTFALEYENHTGGDFRLCVYDGVSEQYSGDISESSGIAHVTVNLATAITQLSVSIARIYDSTALSMRILTAKLELGSVSTIANDPPADYGEELRKCQRYYFARTGMTSPLTSCGNGYSYYNFSFPVEMSAVPSVSITSYNEDYGTPIVGTTTKQGVMFYCASASIMIDFTATVAGLGG